MDLSHIKDPSTVVCKLRKSLYGLKQAPRCWFTKFSDALKEYGYTQSHLDNSLFTIHHNNKFTAILVYVNDILVTGSDKGLIKQLIDFMSSKFKVKDLGPLKYFLGIEVARSSKGIYLHQRKYTMNILKDTGLLVAKPSKLPIEQNHTLQDNSSLLLITENASCTGELWVDYFILQSLDLIYATQFKFYLSS